MKKFNKKNLIVAFTALVLVGSFNSFVPKAHAAALPNTITKTDVTPGFQPATFTGVPVYRLHVTNPSTDTDDTILTIMPTPSGSVNDTLIKLHFYNDPNNGGIVDGSVTDLLSGGVNFTSNDTAKTFDITNVVVPPSGSVNILITADGTGLASAETFMLAIADTANVVMQRTAIGGTTTAANATYLTISTTAADITIASAKITSPSTVLVTLNDPGQNIASVDFSKWHIDRNGGGSSPLTPTSKTITSAGDPWTITLTFDGTPFSDTATAYSAALGLYVDASGVTDTNGDTNVVVLHSSSTIITDGQAPTVAVTMSDVNLTEGETSLVTFTFSEAPIGFSVADVTSFPNGVLSGFTVTGNSLIYTATFTPNVNINDATNIITVGTVWNDTAGNTGVTANSPNYTINTIISGSGISHWGTINVVKIVINDSGGNKTIADFPLFVNGTLVVSGVTNSFPAPASMYTVTETSNSNYTQSFSGDCDISGHLTLSSGDNKFCIITNNDIGAPLPVVPPLIDVVKVPNPLALPAGPGLVTYTYTVKNIGTVPMTDITLVGDTCVPIVLAAGDTNGDAILSTNETWIYRCSTILSATHTNTVVATGWANGISAVDVASATVVVGASIVPPLIHVVKTPNVFIVPSGGAVTYTYTVTNPGTAPLSNVSITDNKCTGLPGRVVGHPGDLNKNNLLESNETWSFTCETNLTKTTTNTGTVTGTANGLTATDFALATVVVTPLTITNPVVIMGCSGGNLFNTSSGQPCINNVGNENQNSSVHSGLYYFGTVTLKNGSKGNAVMELQRFLNAKLNLGLVVDGKLGPKTIVVIKQWQKDHGLVADGLVGAKTKAKMNTDGN